MPDSARAGYYDGQNQLQLTTFKAQDVIDSRGVSTESHTTNSNIHLSSAQATQIAGAMQSTLIGANNGVAPLDGTGKIPVQFINDSGGGGGGGGSLDLSQLRYAYMQLTPSITWTITHNLNQRYVSVQVVDNTGGTIVPDITYTDNNTVTLRFSTGIQGTAIIRN